MSKKYGKLYKEGTLFKPLPDVEIVGKFESGCYTVEQEPMTGTVLFNKMVNNHDGLIDLPNTEYDKAVKELDFFLKSSTEDNFKKYNFIYKRSTLLYGLPGTGKTCIVNRVADKVQEMGGIVLFNPDPRLIFKAFEVITDLNPESLVLVIFEELDELLTRHESILLNILDGEIQKSRVIYMATTNYFDRIPARIRRPGRFSSCIEVNFPSAETRSFYLKSKLKDNVQNIDKWVDITNGFSIDELKETVLAVCCLEQPLLDVVEKIRAIKSLPVYAESSISSAAQNVGLFDHLIGVPYDK
jgi:GTPase SAR1 family protein